MHASTDAQASLTVVLTNWKRPENLQKILETLSAQTVRPEIFLWNNGEKISSSAVSWQVQSSVNAKCWPRWWMASMAKTEFVCILDDDLLLSDDRVLEDLIAAKRRYDPSVIVGLFGVELREGSEYKDSFHREPGEADQRVDIVKGRCMLLRRDALRALHVLPSPAPWVLRCDDIIVSGALSGGKRLHHVLPAGFVGRYSELPAPHALFSDAEHWAERETARRHAFPDPA